MSGPLKRKAAELASTPKKAKADSNITSFFKSSQSSSTEKPKPDASITSFFGQPKPVPDAQSPNASKPAIPAKKPFNKDEWLAKLNDEQKELLKLEIETLHDSWLPYLADEIKSKEFLDLKRFLKREGEQGKKVFPPLEDVYSWYVCLKPISPHHNALHAQCSGH